MTVAAPRRTMHVTYLASTITSYQPHLASNALESAGTSSLGSNPGTVSFLNDFKILNRPVLDCLLATLMPISYGAARRPSKSSRSLAASGFIECRAMNSSLRRDILIPDRSSNNYRAMLPELFMLLATNEERRTRALKAYFQFSALPIFNITFSKSFAVASLFAAASVQLVAAHPGEVHVPLSAAELSRRQLEATHRHIAKRDALMKRSAHRQYNGRFTRREDDTAAANTPTYSTIQNSTCVTAPEVTEGPYYVANELLRTDLREDQAGVDLTLDIGVIDTTTCTPLSDALVEIWNCNATGAYAGFTSASLGAPPSGGSPPTKRSTSMTDQYTWLRGGYATNSEGIVEFKTIYPGYYTSRTVHIHTMVQTNYSVATNGSIISHAGQVRHIGQIFFDEDLNDQVLAQSAYVDTTQIRTLNDDDSVLAEQNTDGFNAFADAELIGSDVTEGVLAYITLGVDTTRTSNIISTNYVTAVADNDAAEATATA